VTGVDVADVGVVENCFAVGREGNVFDFAFAGREFDGRASGGWQTVEMAPTGAFPRED